MDIQDYEFKHFSSIREKNYRRLCFVSQDDFQRTFLVNISQFEQNNKFDLSKILHYLQKKGLILENHNFIMKCSNFIINPDFSNWVSIDYFNSNDLIYQIVQKDFLLPHQGNAKSLSTDSENISLKIQNQIQLQSQINYINLKRVKQPQRKIGEVIQKVKSWRLLYQIDHFSLGDAAKIVGVSKKSLDDYYLVLRNGEYCQFDFKNNLDKGVGLLRLFIRKSNIKIEGRLPKEIHKFKFFEYAQQQDKILDTEIQDSLYQYKIQQSQ